MLPAVLVALAGFAAVTVSWGLPDGASALSTAHWAIDTIGPIGPLVEAYHRFTRAGTEDAIYPLFHYIVLATAYGPYVLIALLTGGLTDPSGEFPYGAAEPAKFFQTLAVIGDLVSIAMAIGIVLIVFDLTRRLFDERAARWAAAFTALLAPLTYYAGTTNLDVPYLFWAMLAVRQLLLGAADGRLRHFIGCGAAAGLALATKDQAIGFFVLWPLLIPLLVAKFRDNVQPGDAWRVLIDPRVLAAVIAVILAYAVGNNLLFGGWHGFVRHLQFYDAFYDARPALDARPLLVRQLDLLAQASLRILQMMGPLTPALGIAGLWRAWRAHHWLSLLLPLFALSYYATIIMPTTAFSRYLLGMALMLMPFAGHAVATGFASRSSAVLWTTRALAFSAVLLQTAMCLHLAQTLRNDSRYEMERWVRANVPERAVIESQTQPRYLPRLSDRYQYVTVANSFDAMSYDLLAGELTAAALHERSPDYVLILQSSGLSGDPERSNDPRLNDYFHGLMAGRMGYTAVARFKTPSYLPFRQITAGTQPTTILLRRNSRPGTTAALAGPSPP